jgi:hypothetical protein
MQLQVNTETKVNDNVTLYTRCNILDKILSSQSTNEDTTDYSKNIQFDRAWMDVKTPVGLFRVGRKEGIKWGTDFYDDGKDWGTDRSGVGLQQGMVDQGGHLGRGKGGHGAPGLKGCERAVRASPEAALSPEPPRRSRRQSPTHLTCEF